MNISLRSAKTAFAFAAILFLVFSGFSLPAPASAASEESGSPMWQCSRHGHNDEKYCGYFSQSFGGGGYAQYSGSYSIQGHRHGGSEIEAIVCMALVGDGSGSCDWFHSWGDGLGIEQGCSPGDDCSPYNYTYKSGNFANFDNPNGPGMVYAYNVHVKDAEVFVTASYHATPKQDINPGGPTDPCDPPNTVDQGGRCVPSCGAAGGNSCNDGGACAGKPLLEAYDCSICCNTSGGGGGYSQGYYQGYYQGGYGGPTHAECQADNNSAGACRRVPGEGSDQCSVDADCRGGGGYDEGGYYSQSSYYSESYYEASYSHSVCTSDGACTIVSGKGNNACGQDLDCPQPPPVCSLTATPSRIVIPPPQTVTLTWSCSPTRIPTNCSITNVGSVAPTGSTTVTPTSSTNYVLQCTNASGQDTVEVKTRVFTGEPGSLKEVVPGGG